MLDFIGRFVQWFMVAILAMMMAGCAASGSLRVTARDPETGESITRAKYEGTLYNDELHQYARDAFKRTVDTAVFMLDTVAAALSPVPPTP